MINFQEDFTIQSTRLHYNYSIGCPKIIFTTSLNEIFTTTHKIANEENSDRKPKLFCNKVVMSFKPSLDMCVQKKNLMSFSVK